MPDTIGLGRRALLEAFGVGSPVPSGKPPERHKIQGIGAGSVPQVLNVDIKVAFEQDPAKYLRSAAIVVSTTSTDDRPFGPFPGRPNSAVLAGAARVY